MFCYQHVHILALLHWLKQNQGLGPPYTQIYYRWNNDFLLRFRCGKMACIPYNEAYVEMMSKAYCLRHVEDRVNGIRIRIRICENIP